MKCKLAVFMLDSYEYKYAQNKEKVPSPHRVGEVHQLTVPFGLPVPSAKGYYWFFTGDGRPEKLNTLSNWGPYQQSLRKKDICFWNKIDRTFAIFGFPLEEHVLSDNVKYFQSIAPLSVVIRPYYWGELNADEIKEAHRVVSRNLNRIDVAQEYISRNHKLYKKMIEEHNDEVDVMLFYYNTDWFSHRLKGPQLLDKISWVDSLVMETMDMIDAENTICFSEHGADHSKNIIFSSTYGYVPKDYGDIIDFIHKKARNE